MTSNVDADFVQCLQNEIFWELNREKVWFICFLLLSFSVFFCYFGSSPVVISLWMKGMRKRAAIRDTLHCLDTHPQTLGNAKEMKLNYCISCSGSIWSVQVSLNCLGYKSRQIINYMHNNPTHDIINRLITHVMRSNRWQNSLKIYKCWADTDICW
jgi:hypothetical protein